MKIDAKRKILVAGMGTSPAVLTNAVWALAHQAVPVIPDEVVVLMTKDGKESLRRALFEEGVWDEMFSDMRREKLDTDGKLVFGEASIHMIPDSRGNEIDDLRTGDDNLRAADFFDIIRDAKARMHWRDSQAARTAAHEARRATAE